MNAGLVAVLILGVIILILVIIIGVRRQHNPTSTTEIQDYLNQIPAPSNWSALENVPSGNRNVCALYTFPTGMQGDQVVVPIPSLNDLDALNPTPYDPGLCYDPDQVVAKQQQRQCLGDTGCYGYDGILYPKGGVQTLYQGCPSSACQGTYGVVAFNFNPSISTASCLEGEPNLTTSGVICDLTNPNQLFRIERTNSTTLKLDPNGSIARIYSRSLSGCLQPASNNIVTGLRLVIGPCSSNSGFNWILVPPQTYSDGTASPQLMVWYPFWTNGIPTDFRGSFVAAVVNSVPQLIPFVVYSQSNPSAGNVYNTQVLDLTLFNLLNTIPINEGYPFPPTN